MSKRPRPTEHAPESPEGGTPEPQATEQLAFTDNAEWHSELTRELLERLVCCARIGGSRKATAYACHVKPDVLKTWLQEGMRFDGPELMRELSARYHAIVNQMNLILVGAITQAAARGEWQAAYTMLQVREPEEWGGKAPEEPIIPPELSIAQREEMLLDALKDENNPLTKIVRKALGFAPSLEPLDLGAQLGRKPSS